MLNNHGPSIEPCGTLRKIADHELYVPLNFTLCFRLVSMSATVLEKEYLPRKHKVWRLAVHEAER